MKMLLTKAKNDGYRIIYIDETMVTRKTVVDAEWSRPKENMSVDVAKLEEPTLALLCGISKEKGLEHYQIYDNSVNVDKFMEYLQELRTANPEDKITLFMDNLSAHIHLTVLRRQCGSMASASSTICPTSLSIIRSSASSASSKEILGR